MSNYDKFSEDVFKKKKEFFLDVVIKASGALGIEPPEVNFWETTCPEDSGEEIAHCHPQSKTICISRKWLLALDFDKLQDTATHEVTHLIQGEHGSDFRKIHQNINVAIWKPPTGYGVAHISEAQMKSRKIKLTKKKVKKGECRYHLCEDNATEKCPYCKKKYCELHAKPKQTGMPRFDTAVGAVDFIRLENWRSEKGHPCLLYNQLDPKGYRFPRKGEVTHDLSGAENDLDNEKFNPISEEIRLEEAKNLVSEEIRREEAKKSFLALQKEIGPSYKTQDKKRKEKVRVQFNILLNGKSRNFSGEIKKIDENEIYTIMKFETDLEGRFVENFIIGNYIIELTMPTIKNKRKEFYFNKDQLIEINYTSDEDSIDGIISELKGFFNWIKSGFK